MASELSRAAVFLAGALAEHTMLGTDYAYEEDEVVQEAIMNEEILRDLAPDDLCRAISIIRQIGGVDHVDFILSGIRKIEAATVRILGRADVRRSIETVADRLLQHNALTVGMVVECLAPDVMHGGSALTGKFQAVLEHP